MVWVDTGIHSIREEISTGQELLIWSLGNKSRVFSVAQYFCSLTRPNNPLETV